MDTYVYRDSTSDGIQKIPDSKTVIAEAAPQHKAMSMPSARRHRGQSGPGRILCLRPSTFVGGEGGSDGEAYEGSSCRRGTGGHAHGACLAAARAWQQRVLGSSAQQQRALGGFAWR